MKIICIIFEEKKEQLHDEMVQKTNLFAFHLDRQEQYIRRENILIYGAEENKEDNDDGEKVLFKQRMSLKSISKLMKYREYID